MRIPLILTMSLQVLLLCCCEKPEPIEQDPQQMGNNVIKIANTSTHDVCIEIFQHSHRIKPFSYCVFQEGEWAWQWSDDNNEERTFLTDSITLVFDDSVRMEYTRTDEGFYPSLHNLFDTASYYTYHGWYHTWEEGYVNANISQYTITDYDYPGSAD